MKEDKVIRSLMYGDVVKQLAHEKNIGLTEAKMLLSQMSFSEYHSQVTEASADITPPSGNMISPSTNRSSSTQKSNAPSQSKLAWPGKGSPVEIGMTVGIKGPTGLPVPGEVSQVDMGSKGVKIKNPTTGQDEWRNTDELEPFMAADNRPQTNQNIRPGEQPDATQLARLQELAGIKENCSAGATGAGSIAGAAMPMGKMKRRQETAEEAPPKEYTRTEPAKTIVGDTKPKQASGELSANLAIRGKKTATRTNNGIKR